MGGDRSAEFDVEALDRDPAEVVEGVDDHQPAPAQDRDPVATRSTSDNVCDERKTVRPCAGDLSEKLVEALLHERIEPGDRLVEDQRARGRA